MTKENSRFTIALKSHLRIDAMLVAEAKEFVVEEICRGKCEAFEQCPVVGHNVEVLRRAGWRVWITCN